MSISPGAKKLGRPVDEARQARRIAEILDAAATLFAQQGYAETDTQVIADTLGIGKGTIYRYFKSKEALFLGAVDRVMRRMQERIQRRTVDVVDPLERIEEAIRAYLSFFAEHPQFVELLIQERATFKDRKQPTYFEHREKNAGPWRELLARMIAEGRVREIPVTRIADTMSALLYGTIFTNYFTGRKISAEQQANDILDITFLGILSDRERKARGK